MRTGATDVEEFDLSEPPRTGGRDRIAGPRRSQSHAWHRRAAAWVVLALGLTAIGGAVAEPIALSQTTGIAGGLSGLDLAGAPAVAWESELSDPELLGAAGHRAVVAVESTVTSRDLVGIDLGTGEQAWRHHDRERSCVWSAPLACVEGVGQPTATIVLIDLDDGARADRPAPGALAAVAVGEDVVIALAGDDESEVIVRVGPDGEERWRTSAETVDTTLIPMWSILRIDGDTVVTLDSVLDVGTGEVLGEPSGLPAGSRYEPAPDGSGVLRTPNGDVPLVPDELAPYATDDLGGPVALTQQGDVLVATLRSSGDELWVLDDASFCQVNVIVRAALVVTCWKQDIPIVHGLDLLTGEERWQLGGVTWQLSQGSETVLFFDEITGDVVAVDIRSGDVEWQLATSGAGSWAAAYEISDGLLLLTGSALTRLTFGS